jgi:flagellar biosynthesis/type III secretory pathway chaperone
MNPSWTPLVEALREELAGYGGLLHLFERQQLCLFERDAESVLRLSGEIEQQAGELQAVRRRREELTAFAAQAGGRPAAATLRSLLPVFPADVRPLLEALVAEVNVLIHRVRRTSRHNRLLLARAVETHHQTLRVLRPDAFTQTYAPDGRSALGTVRPSPALQAAG